MSIRLSIGLCTGIGISIGIGVIMFVVDGSGVGDRVRGCGGGEGREEGVCFLAWAFVVVYRGYRFLIVASERGGVVRDRLRGGKGGHFRAEFGEARSDSGGHGLFSRRVRVLGRG